MPKTPEERAKIKAGRLLEKAMRKPINDVVLDIQNGTISLKSVISRIEAKVKEGTKNAG